MVQEVTTQSWGSRLASSFFGIFLGLALIVGSFILVFWNEGHGLHTSQSLEQTQQVLITVPISPINDQNNLKVVYITGPATTTQTLEDPLLGINSQAIRLDRKVEMYQWREEEGTKTEKQLGGSEKTTKTYSYKTVWSTDLINSSKFKDAKEHQNPKEMPFKSRIQEASKVNVGDFNLPSFLISKITNSEPVDLAAIDTTKLKEKTSLKVQAVDKNLYIGEDPQNPQVGDLRISVFQVLPQAVSVIAQQTDHTLQAYIPRAGQPVALLVSGEVSAGSMIHQAQVENQMLTWLLRGASLFLMIFGIALILNPLVVLADVVPLMGKIVEFGTGIIAFVGGLLLWAIATAIAWFVVRPVYAAGLIIIVIAICYWVLQRRKRQVVSSEK